VGGVRARFPGADLSGRGYTVQESTRSDGHVARRHLGPPPRIEHGANVATAIAFDHDGDCGVYSMSTVESVRQRGFGTALTARHLHHAVERGCATASLQSTPMAEGIYAAVGFRDLGRFLEFSR
jgi:GNAT superfamily N-acetyltransferase